jgi:glycine/D-amino acid oxidase-like deaminating enzyme
VSGAGFPDVIVVGAGIVGAACADSLSRRNLSVLVVDSRFPGAGATAAGMGHIVVMDDSEAQFSLTERSRRLWEESAADLPEECEDRACGTLWVAADEDELGAVRAKADFYRARGVDAEILDGRQLGEAEPNLRPGLAGALRVPGDRVLYPPNAARWLLARAKERGARVREGCPIIELGPAHARLESGRIDAGSVVNAAGAEAPRLTAGLPISPRKGHLVITDRYPGFCRHQIVELGYLKSAHGGATGPSVAFNLQPRATGQLLLGSSREFAGWSTDIDSSILERMVRRGLDYMPGLARLNAIRAWTGLRPATPDKLPLIGRLGEGPWIAAGHEGLGITTALATGELLASLMTGSPAPLDPAPFDPNRFPSPPNPSPAGRGWPSERGRRRAG